MQINRYHFDFIDSTNTWAKQNAHLLSLDAITLVTADFQSAGRGRFKRRWVSASKQNILASFCFFVDHSRADLGNIPQILALSVIQTLEVYGFKPLLKWPNDILINGKKIGGILAETTMVDNGMCMVVGIGLNVNMPLNLLQEIDLPATSMFVESLFQFDIETVLDTLKIQFVDNYNIFLKEGFSRFCAMYRQYLPINLKVMVQFHDNLNVHQGSIEAINDDGSLVLRLADNTLRTFISGEILY